MNFLPNTFELFILEILTPHRKETFTMMTSINRTYTPSTGNYKTPKNETESSSEVRADKKLITLLKDREKFEALAGKDNILTVKEAADLLKNNNRPLA